MITYRFPDIGHFISDTNLNQSQLFHDIRYLIQQNINKEKYAEPFLSEYRLEQIQYQLEMFIQKDNLYLNG